MNSFARLLIPALLLIAFAAGCTDRMPPAPGDSVTLSLRGVVWQLDRIEQQGKLTIVDSGITLVFDAGTMRGDGPCNRYEGTYSAGAIELTCAGLSWTERHCPAAELEGRYFRVLAATESYLLGSGQLRLFGDRGATVLIYNRTDRAVSTVPRDTIPVNAWEPIDSTAWVLASISQNGVVDPVRDLPPTILAFENAFAMTGLLACGGPYGGNYAASKDSIKLDVTYRSGVGCTYEEFIMRYLELIADVETYRWSEHELLLFTAGRVATLRYERYVGVPHNARIEEREWRLVFMKGADSSRPREFPTAKPSWIRFQRDSLVGYGFCNPFRGSFDSGRTPDSGVLSIIGFDTMNERCQEIGDEIQLHGILQSVTGYRVTDTTLTLYARKGELRYRTR